jgi:hypothetical protein
MFRTKFVHSERAMKYATAASFIEIYNEEMHSLFLLSILLTADLEKAEQCFVGALEECLYGFDVFMEWARLWARRAIIKRAIKLINPVPQQPGCQSLTGIQWHSTLVNSNLIGAILMLSAFERVVFVVSLLERQSDEDCAAMLNSTRLDIQLARVRALKSLPSTESACGSFREALQAWEIIRELQNVRTDNSMNSIRHCDLPQTFRMAAMKPHLS